MRGSVRAKSQGGSKSHLSASQPGPCHWSFKDSPSICLLQMTEENIKQQTVTSTTSFCVIGYSSSTNHLMMVDFKSVFGSFSFFKHSQV